MPSTTEDSCTAVIQVHLYSFLFLLFPHIRGSAPYAKKDVFEFQEAANAVAKTCQVLVEVAF